MKTTATKKQKTPKVIEKVEVKAAKLKRQFDGVVVSTKENKTIRVVVRNIKTNAKYKKQFAVIKKYPVHDELKVAKVGDAVCFEECKPLSKTKKWRLVKVIKSAK